jgi:hypothetical protein
MKLSDFLVVTLLPALMQPNTSQVMPTKIGVLACNQGRSILLIRAADHLLMG